MFDLDHNSVFAVDDIIFISDKVNIYEGKAAVLGKYNDNEECKSVLLDIVSCEIKENKVYLMPKKEEREENENQ